MRTGGGRGLVLAAVVVALAGPLPAQAPGRGSTAPARRAPEAHQHGTPAGWRFAWPAGDAARGREVFVKLSCYTCHEVRGEDFPAPSDADAIGPELSQMGPAHEPEYFAESIINPGAQIEKGHGYAAPDGSSRMPSYNDSVSVQEVVDLVAYLRALRPPPARPAAPGPPGAARPSPRHPTH